jgi:5'-nucleotidase
MIPSTGFKYVWDGAKACDARISSVTLTRNGVTETIVDAAGKVLAPSKTHRVTVNNFMATGGDGFTTFLSGTSALGGAQDIDVLTAFMAGYKAPAAPYVPGGNANDNGSVRIQRTGGTSCPTGASVNA